MHKALMIKVLKKRGITKLEPWETAAMAIDRSGGYPTKQELMEATKREKHYISFGQTHEHKIEDTILNKDVLFEVVGDYEKAQSTANLLFGKKYANIYSEDKLPELKEYYKGIVSIAGWSFKTDYKKYTMRRVLINPRGFVEGTITIEDEIGNMVMSINIEGGNSQIFERMDTVLLGRPSHTFTGKGNVEVNIEYD